MNMYTEVELESKKYCLGTVLIKLLENTMNQPQLQNVSKGYIRFFALNVKIHATRPLKKFKGMLRHFNRLQDKDLFNQKLSENYNKIAQLTKKLEKLTKVSEGNRERKKKIIEQLRVLNIQK